MSSDNDIVIILFIWSCYDSWSLHSVHTFSTNMKIAHGSEPENTARCTLPTAYWLHTVWLYDDDSDHDTWFHTKFDLIEPIQI